MSQQILVSVEENGIARLGLNMNETNSFDLEAFAAFSQALKTLSERSDVRVLIIHSLQKDVFSQGLNLQQMAAASEDTVGEFVRLFFENLRDLYLFPHPVICAMNGHAMGYGCMLAIVSDYRYLPEKARIGLPEVKLGIRVPAFVARIFQQIVGTAEAGHLLLEGGAYKGIEAKTAGLIDETVEGGAVLQHAEKQAQKFLKNSRSATSATKRAMRQSVDVEALIQIDLGETIKTLGTADAQEGITAVVEMRRPKFG